MTRIFQAKSLGQWPNRRAGHASSLWRAGELHAPAGWEYLRSVEPTPTITWTAEEDPVVAMLLRGEAATSREAEARYLDTHLTEIVDLVNSPLSDTEFRRHPLIPLPGKQEPRYGGVLVWGSGGAP